MVLQPGKYGGTYLNSAQLRNANIIARVGYGMGASDNDVVVALMAAMQESTLKNLQYGDRDSLGLFQQRPSAGWGTPEQVTNPEYAATQFFQRLLALENRSNLSFTMRAQKVQRSAFPQAYAKWKAMATSVVEAIGGTPSDSNSDGGTGLDEVLSVLTDTSTWYRIGLFLMGIGLLGAGIGFWVISRG